MSTSITNISDFVEIKDEQVYTTSRIVSEKFGKKTLRCFGSYQSYYF